jgi:hypothetical protein
MTCDPANVRRIFVSSFSNYPEGEEFASFFDVMADSFFNVDVMSSARLLGFMERCNAFFDLQDVFTRFSFDMTWARAGCPWTCRQCTSPRPWTQSWRWGSSGTRCWWPAGS